MEGKWFCYKASLFNEGGMVMLENGRYGGGQFKAGRIVILQRWPV